MMSSREESEAYYRYTFIVTEVVRWIAMVVPLAFAVWRYAYFKGYMEFVPDTNCTIMSDGVSAECLAQYWGIVIAIVVSGTLIVYMPLKYLFSRTVLKEARYNWGWRPSVLTYLSLCALPCFTIILVAIKTSDKGADLDTLDSYTLVAIQVAVMGLTVTEWMAKIREEFLTYDLVSAMAVDFFFAYDVFDFFNMLLVDKEMFKSSWLYVNFIFGFVAMFKYIPHVPTSLAGFQAERMAVVSILVSMFCNDIPFVIIRAVTMTVYGLDVSDIVHLAKNVALIAFNLMQVYIIHTNKEEKGKKNQPRYEERRCERHCRVIVTPSTSGGHDVDIAMVCDDI